MPGILEAVFFSVVVHCRNKQITQPLWLKLWNISKNNVMPDAVLPDNGGCPHCRLRPNKFHSCLWAFYDCPSSLSPDTSESRPYNNLPLSVLNQLLFVESLKFFRHKPSNRLSYASRDQPPWRYMLCFFLPDKTPQLIYFNGFGFFRQIAGVLNFCLVSVNPINNRLMIDSEQPADPSEIVTFDIHSDSLFPNFFGVTARLWLDCIGSAAIPTQHSLRSRTISPCFYLPLFIFTTWTFLTHLPKISYQRSFSHSQQIEKVDCFTAINLFYLSSLTTHQNSPLKSEL